jgi:putative phosphoesterase
MFIGVVSDTHGHAPNTRRAVRMLESLNVDQVLHCGDIGSSEIVAMFSAWPTHFVFGNVDYDRETLRKEIAEAGQSCHEVFGTLRFEECDIAFLHGDDSRRLDQTIRDARWQLVCHGHTHVARCERIGKTLVLNPGAVYRANPHSIAVVELPSVRATIVPLD